VRGFCTKTENANEILVALLRSFQRYSSQRGHGAIGGIGHPCTHYRSELRPLHLARARQSPRRFSSLVIRCLHGRNGAQLQFAAQAAVRHARPRGLPIGMFRIHRSSTAVGTAVGTATPATLSNVWATTSNVVGDSGDVGNVDSRRNAEHGGPSGMCRFGSTVLLTSSPPTPSNVTHKLRLAALATGIQRWDLPRFGNLVIIPRSGNRR